MRRTARGVAPLTMGICLVCLTSCGGGSKPTATTAKTTAKTTAAPPATAGSATTDSVSTGPVRATLRGTGHAPAVGRNWVYTVTATDATGHPLTGTVTSEFVFAGTVVGRETPPTHPLKGGRLHDVIQFPARAAGIPLIFQTVVHTPSGNVILGWPVKVRS